MQTEIGSILSGETGNISIRPGKDKRYTKPHEFVAEAYTQYLHDHGSNASVNGRLFEFIICETLVREGIVPFYYQAQFTLVPNADLDIVCYHPKHSIVLSAKVSLRERYKQADLEGLVLNQVYRNDRTYLLTLDSEQVGVQKKIEAGDVAGLTACLRADLSTYDTLLDELKAETFSLADPIVPIEGRMIE